MQAHGSEHPRVTQERPGPRPSLGEVTHHGAGDAEVEGSLPPGRLQQDAEGTWGEAELRRAASGQQQGGTERRSLRGGHHAALRVPGEELQGTEQGRDIGGARRAAVAPGTLPTRRARREAPAGLINTFVGISLLRTLLDQATAAAAAAFPSKRPRVS